MVLKDLGILLKNYVTGNYNNFEGEEDLVAGGVALGAVHCAKGWSGLSCSFPQSQTAGFRLVAQAKPELADPSEALRRLPIRRLGCRRAPALPRRTHPQP